MSRMTVEEKIGQLNLHAAFGFVTAKSGGDDDQNTVLIRQGQLGGVYGMKNVEQMTRLQKTAVEESRLGIPLLFGMDVIHGLETTFPIPLALSSSWNMELVESVARTSAVEATALGINWVFSPMVDISRDARWGRVAEGGGEDPYLGGEIARAYIRGYQGRDNDLSRPDNAMACVKHFALYGASIAGRDYNTVEINRQTAYNEYLHPFKAAFDQGAGSVMTAFNEFEGIPATCNEFLLDTLLRQQWGFDGFVVSDATAVMELVNHGIGDLQEVSARALQAGLDMDMNSDGFTGTLVKSLDEGRIKEKDIDLACRRILEAKYKLGLFDDPYLYLDPSRATREVYTEQTRRQAREIAHECQVLLKNNGVLPLKKGGRIAVIGPFADNALDMQGAWAMSSRKEESVTIYEGIKNTIGDRGTVSLAEGSWILADPVLEKKMRDGLLGFFIPCCKGEPVHQRPLDEMIAEAVSLARGSDVVVACLGEHNNMNGEGASRSDIDLPVPQRELLKALVATGRPVVLLLSTGRPLALVWEDENADAILNTWSLGAEAGNAIADVLFGEVNPSGKLTMTFPRNVGQCPIFYNHKNTGRPHGDYEPYRRFTSNYIDVLNAPLYPFGYGLSYTTYEYGEVRLSSPSMERDESVEVSVKVTNTGDRDGQETVQLYIRDIVSTMTRPVKELKKFAKVSIAAGETKEVVFDLTAEDLKYYNHALKFVCEPGDFEIMIGPDSRDTKSATLTVN